MTIAVLTLPAWPPAVFALFALTVFWFGWHSAVWAHQPPKPQPWRYKGRHTGPAREPDPANYGRHAVQVNADGTLVELKEPRYEDDPADWYDAHKRRLHDHTPDPACMFCKVNQMAGVSA